MKRADFRGTRQVFRFTLAQHYKSKSTLVSLIIMFVFALFSTPLMNSIAGSERATTQEGLELKTLYVENNTPYVLDSNALGEVNGAYVFLEVIPCEAEPGEDIEDAAYLRLEQGAGGCAISAEGLSPAVNDGELAALCAAADTVIKRQVMLLSGISAEQIAILNASCEVNTDKLSSFGGDSPVTGDEGYFLVSYVLSILIMMLTLFSSVSIIQSVVEEKSSKLVELLMVSIEPLALILGKILAVMCFIFGGIIFIGMGLGLSTTISRLLFNTGTSTSQLGVYLDVIKQTSLTDVLVFLVSLALGYLTFALISGLAGARCSNMEDAGSANLLVTLIVMACYMAAVMQSAFDSTAVSLVLAVCPMFSVFCAPASFICGRIGLWTLLLSWVLQAGVIVLLARLAARVYRNLIIYNGNKLKFRAILRMAKEAKA